MKTSMRGRGSRKIVGRWTVLLLLGISSASCEQIKEVCDFECGKFASGDVSISGNPQIDGFFKALNNLDLAVTAIRGRFDADVLAVAEAFGVPAGVVDAAYIDQVKAAVMAEFTTKLVGGKPQVLYEAPQCEGELRCCG